MKRTGRRRVVVTGAAGQLGSALAALWGEDDEVVPLTRSGLDVGDEGAVRLSIARLAPGVVVNAAAYNDVERAEAEPLAALRVNALGVSALARAAAEAGATLVHFSSDFVLDGTKEAPWVEDDAARALSVYGASKLLGERLALAAPGAYVLRVESLFGGPLARSSVDRIVEALERGEEVRVFSDRTVSPTYVPDLVATVRALLDRSAAPGLYHAANDGFTTWEGLAREAARLLGATPRLVPVRLADAPLRASRPLRCALDPARLRSLGLAPPHWRDALRRCLAERGAVGAPREGTATAPPPPARRGSSGS